MRTAPSIAACLAALSAMAASAAIASPCPAAQDVSQSHLIGTWRATIDGQPPLLLQLAKDPEYAETVLGTLVRDGRTIQLAGDVDDGALTLEESSNGKNISAAWIGEVVDGSCGREIRGTWKAEGASAESAFVLKKQ